MIVPGRNGHKINATVENARFAIANDVLTLKYQQAVDGIQASIDDSVSELPDEPASQSSASYDDNNSGPGEIRHIYSLSVNDQVEVF